MKRIPVEAVDGLEEIVHRMAREIARDEIASMAGLVLRRVQNPDEHTTIGAIFGEVLRDFGGTPAEPGDE